MKQVEIIEGLQIERECIRRNFDGECDRKCDLCDIVQNTEYLLKVYDSAIESLKSRKTGHWIPIGATFDLHNGVRMYCFKCSECGERTNRVDSTRHINFCPMCGRKMEKGDDYNYDK